MKKAHNQSIAFALETWFVNAQRPMPWRLRPSPYVCWLSEIMMQQTTYASVLPYYTRFLSRFPSVEKLAAASEADVLKAWEGLGYYARARNLLKAAQGIVRDGRPVWPRSAAEWRNVPGVGPYTAAALASVLDGERIPVVDGNVARVFARFWELADDFKKLPARERLAARLQPEIERADNPGNFNQAMMELGALVCTPTDPACEACPLATSCAAHKHRTHSKFPTRIKKKELPIRCIQAIIVTNEKDEVLLVQNHEGGLLKGLWELPTVEASHAVCQAFSHFKVKLETFHAIRQDAAFKDPQTVPLATTARKALAAIGIGKRNQRMSERNS